MSYDNIRLGMAYCYIARKVPTTCNKPKTPQPRYPCGCGVGHVGQRGRKAFRANSTVAAWAARNGGRSTPPFRRTKSLRRRAKLLASSGENGPNGGLLLRTSTTNQLCCIPKPTSYQQMGNLQFSAGIISCYIARRVPTTSKVGAEPTNATPATLAGAGLHGPT